ncbi:sensor histidine kinase [Larkinella sp.]|uniref:sensor histidine kinase n=1 Tax=Larkinella sp. TaxID=2034517 RepID=UPI003BA8A5C6
MKAPGSDHLTIWQKAQLALSIFVIYWPIRLYMNIDQISGAFLVSSLPFWALEIPLTIFFFFCWLLVTDWLQQRVLHWFGSRALVEMKLPVQIGILLVASALAVVFNGGFNQIRAGMAESLNLQFPPAGHRPPIDQAYRSGWAGNRNQRQKMNNGITVMAMLSAFYLAANRRSGARMLELEIQTERLEKESAQAQFMALKNQVNPHFLFNSLSILSSLVEVDAKLSVQFINRLSKAYRYILEQRDNERTRLQTELDFIDAYTFLLKIRFDEKLQVAITVSETDANRYAIAPLTLQLLIENAVKHNQMSAQKPLLVSIYTEGDYLVVANPLQLRPQNDSSTGVGLQNIMNRYALLTDRPVWVGEQDDQFVVKIPLLP